MQFEEWVESKGFTLADLNDAQVASLRAAWRAEENPAAPAPEPEPDDNGNGELTKATGAIRAERDRQAKIVQLVAEQGGEHHSLVDDIEKVGRDAIRNKWTVQQAENKILRLVTAPPPPSPLGRSGGPVLSDRVVEAALAQAGGLKGVEKQYDERTLDAAHKQFRGGLGIQQLLYTAAIANGYRGTASVKANLHEVMRYAFTPKASGISTISVSGILGATANKFSREAFMFVEQEWSKIAARRPVSDFKAITTYSLSGDLTYEEIAPGGFIKHGTLGETSYTNQAKSYGRMLGLDRRDIINDDLGVFASLFRKLGRGGAIKVNKVVWGAFLDNSSFFSSGNSNVTTGAGSLLSGATAISGLDAALVVFRRQTDPNGDLMGVMPKILLVPPALFASASNLMDSTKQVATTTANSGIPDGNPFAGMLQIVSSAYMQDSTLTGNSATASYILADPNDVAVIEVCFLNGQETPTVESADADFNQLGVQFRAYHDFGAAKQEYRGGVRLAGA